MTAAASTAVVEPSGPHPGFGATVDGTAGTTAELLQVGAHVDDRVQPFAGGTPGPAVQSHAGRWSTWAERENGFV